MYGAPGGSVVKEREGGMKGINKSFDTVDTVFNTQSKDTHNGEVGIWHQPVPPQEVYEAFGLTQTMNLHFA